MKRLFVLIPVMFIAALIISVGLEVVFSPDFSGFTKIRLDDPNVYYLPGEGGAKNGKGGDQVLYNWKNHPVFIVGDSLTQGAKKDIAKAVQDATIDARVGRTMSQGLSIIEDWDSSGALPDDAIIVVCLAHNITGYTVSAAEQIVDMIRPGQSLVMMTGHGLSDMAKINEYIRSLPQDYDYVTVADWDLTVAQSPGLLGDDGIHIGKRQGNELYANMILGALEATQPRQ